MQVVILAGGLGTRLSEETVNVPKPMVRVGQDPIIVHLMKYYASYGHTDFVIALGYKGDVIKEYFSNFGLHRSSIEVNLSKYPASRKSSDAKSADLALPELYPIKIRIFPPYLLGNSTSNKSRFRLRAICTKELKL